MNKTIVIGISSGIAAYKIVDLIKILKTSSKGRSAFGRKNIEIEVIMTQTAVKMFGKKIFEDALGKKVYSDLISKDFDYKKVLQKREVEHIKLAGEASLFILAPATANIIGKVACGIANDLLTTTLLAVSSPVLICPSMNTKMWSNPLVQENINKLKQFGFFILQPDSGRLACGSIGVGRLPEPEIIAKELFYLLQKKNQLKGKKIIVTAGGTQEPIDAVRVITNRASGKMGAALAEECYLQGAEVLLLRSKNSVSSRFNVKEEIFETSKDLEGLIKNYAQKYDVIFHSAAVSDFIPENKLDEKLDSQKHIILRLYPAEKILHQIKSWNPKIKLIGFKAVFRLKEEELIKTGMKKLKDSHSDFVIVNDVGKEGIGFGVDTNEVYIISPKGLLAKVPKATKREIAQRILEYLFK
jgi:phosphopantothenoylcysteine decarboxylase/phosphopantothenate--cysteine ligase